MKCTWRHGNNHSTKRQTLRTRGAQARAHTSHQHSHQDDIGELNIAAVYSPPKHVIKEADYITFFRTLRHRFIAGGDYNAKNSTWDARLTTPKGRELFKAMSNNNLQYLSTRQPTFWPSDTDNPTCWTSA